MKNHLFLDATFCLLFAVFISGSVKAQSRAHCGESKKDCSLGPWTGGDGKAQIYKLLCCELDDECGSALLPGQKRPDPYCKSVSYCHYWELNRERNVKYDPKEECCTAYGPEQKFPILNFEHCRKTRVGRPFVSHANGCGPKDKPVDPTDGETLANGRTIGGAADFTEVCKAHDGCYDTCNSDRNTCDAKFLAGMNAVCDSKYKKGALLVHCKKMAKNWFYAGAQTFGGSYYDDAQKEACQCCPDERVGSIMDIIILPRNFDWGGLFFEQAFTAAGS